MAEFATAIGFLALLLGLGAVILAIVAYGKAQRQERDVRLLRDQLRALTHKGQASADEAARARRLADAIRTPPPPPSAEPAARPVAPPRVEPGVAEAKAPASPTPRTLHVQPAPSASAPPARRVKPRRGWEERIGTLLPIWIGAIALALAGAYLFKYSIDNNWLTEVRRVWLGYGFGVIMLAAGLWLYRKAERIAAALAAAAIAVLFITTFAATEMYGLLTPLQGFGVLGLVAALAVGLSLRHGQLVAILGLVGGFATPAIVAVGEPQAEVTFPYLFVLQLGLIVVTRRRGWWWLTVLTMVAAMAWAGAWMLRFDYSAEQGAWIGLFLLASAASVVWSNKPLDEGESLAARIGSKLIWLGLVMAAVLLAALVGASDFSALEWAYLGLIGGACIVLGRLRSRFEGLAWLCAAETVAMLVVWWFDLRTGEVQAFCWTTAALGGVYLLGGYAAMWRAVRPARWAVLAASAAVVFYVVAWAGASDALPSWVRWWAVALVAAAALVALAVPIYRRRAKMAQGDLALAAFATGATALVSIAMPIAFDETHLSVAWALEVPALALIGVWLRIGVLRKLAAALVVGVIVRLCCNPHLLDTPIGLTMGANWLTWVYGSAVLALVVAAWVYLKWDTDGPIVQLIEGAALALTFVLVGLEVRHGYSLLALPAAHGLEQITLSVDVNRCPLRESSTYVIAWLSLACALLVVARWVKRPALIIGAVVITGAAATVFVVMPGAGANPLLNRLDVGERLVVNWIGYAYGLPAVIAGVLAWLAHRRGVRPFAVAAGGASALMLLAMVVLQIRHGFHGPSMHEADLTLIEAGTYVNAALLIALGVMAVGRFMPALRLHECGVGLAMIALCVGAVTLGYLVNPVREPFAVGKERIFNWLIYLYGLPALLAALIGGLNRSFDRRLMHVFSVAALVMLFGFVTLEVRQWYWGALLDSHETIDTEWYTYSAVWVALGTVLLVAGIVSRSAVLRWASLVVMAVSVVKVFVSDTAHLEDLYRVASFFGLGVSLLVLAFLYQRFVFRRPREEVVIPEEHEAGPPR